MFINTPGHEKWLMQVSNTEIEQVVEDDRREDQ